MLFPELWQSLRQGLQEPYSVQFPNCALSLQLGEQLAQLVPASGVDVVELEDEGTCVRFSPLMTSAGNIHSSQPLVRAGLCYGMV